MHRFIVDDRPLQGEVALPPEEAEHAARVLRLRPGVGVELIDGRGRVVTAEVASVGKRDVTARVTGECPGRESPVRLTVYIGCPKGEKLELVAQKLTELGAARLCPVVMERSVARGERFEGRMGRLQRIAREAVKQCGRGLIPEIAAPMTWDEVLSRLPGHGLALIPWEEARDGRLRDLWAAHPDQRDIALIVGPEGGMSAGEVQAAREASARPITLGPRILRAETAAIAAAAAVMALWADL